MNVLLDLLLKNEWNLWFCFRVHVYENRAIENDSRSGVVKGETEICSLVVFKHKSLLGQALEVLRGQRIKLIQAVSNSEYQRTLLSSYLFPQNHQNLLNFNFQTRP